MKEVKFKKIHENAVIPRYATEEAACMDVVATRIIRSIGLVTVFLGFATEIPKGFEMSGSTRSSFTGSGWILQNTPLHIDSDYRGEWKLVFEGIPKKFYPESQTFGYVPFPYNEGDRVAQIWLNRIEPFKFKEANELKKTKRGTGGFGSTGK